MSQNYAIAAAAILAAGVYRMWYYTPPGQKKAQELPYQQGGIYATDSSYVNNWPDYIVDNTHVISRHSDIYGIPETQIRQPDGSVLRVHGNFSDYI